MDRPQSKTLFIPHWRIWRFLGIYNDFTTLRYPYIVYSLLINVLISICYPLHVLLGIYTSPLVKDNFKSVAVGFGCLESSMKLLVFAIKLYKLHELELIFDLLDTRIATEEELVLFRQIRRDANQIFRAFVFICTCLGTFTAFSILLKTDRSLFQAAWLPFDWSASDTACNIANSYQFLGIFYQLLQNFADDTFPGMVLCLLAGHIQMLGLRVSRIGYDNKDLVENEKALYHCILDQKAIYRLLELVQDIISWTMFFQFVLTLFNVCMVLAALLYYVDSMFDRLFYVSYLLAQQLEIFPTCYYGSSIEILLSHFHYDVYSSNWMDQSRNFKKHMILLTERSLKRSSVMAKMDVAIHLDTFFRTLKATYSLFAVIIKVKG